MSNPGAGDESALDYYEVLQINPNAEPETVHRVYRLLAQRFHPDNKESGDDNRFQILHEAYLTLRDPEKRAQYDVMYDQWRKRRWRLQSSETRAESDFELENVIRLTVLEILYSHRRAEMNAPGVFVLELEDLTGHAREHLEFTLWYLAQKGYVRRGDNTRIEITAEGVDYLEEHYREGLQQRRLKAPKDDEVEGVDPEDGDLQYDDPEASGVEESEPPTGDWP